MGENYITCREENGSINISEDVIAGMVRNAVDTIISVSYGSSVVKVARAVQEKVLAAVQATTGLEKVEVNVHVTGIAFDK